MHSFFGTMLSKIAITMPLGTGAFPIYIYTNRNQLNHFITNLIYSL